MKVKEAKYCRDILPSRICEAVSALIQKTYKIVPDSYSVKCYYFIQHMYFKLVLFNFDNIPIRAVYFEPTIDSINTINKNVEFLLEDIK